MHRLKVLVLEDNSFQLMALHQMLNANGVFNVLNAESVAAARQSLDNKGPVDIAICDLYLEQADGLELIRYLAEQQRAKALIILSDAQADVREGAAAMARQQGLNVLGCLPKPASVTLVNELLSLYQQCFEPGPQALSLAQVRDILVLDMFQPQAPTAEEGQAAVLRHGVAHFQPVVSQDGAIQGVEALARWQHPEHGLMLPADFLPVIEFAGLEEAFTWLMLEQAMQLSAGVRLVMGRSLAISVNIPVGMLELPNFARQLEAQLRRFEVPAQLLTLEIVETTELETDTAHVEALLRLRMIGCKLSIGDFGTGGTSLQRLLELPFTELKIPPAFVCGLAADERKSAVVAGAMSMARRMSLGLVLAGIESAADYEAANKLGQARLQGCFIAEPMSAVAVRQWIVRRLKDDLDGEV